MRTDRARPSIVLAHTVSAVSYPYLLVPATVAASLRLSSHHQTAGSQPVLWLLAGVMVIVAAYAWRGVRSGRHTNFDVSVRDQRGGLYAVALGSMSAASAYLFFTNSSAARPMIVATSLLAVARLANARLKVSLHALFAAFSAGLLYGASPSGSAALAVFAVMIGWSRVHLGRHRVSEVIVGLTLGAAGSLCLYL